VSGKSVLCPLTQSTRRIRKRANVLRPGYRSGATTRDGLSSRARLDGSRRRRLNGCFLEYGRGGTEIKFRRRPSNLILVESGRFPSRSRAPQGSRPRPGLSRAAHCRTERQEVSDQCLPQAVAPKFGEEAAPAPPPAACRQKVARRPSQGDVSGPPRAVTVVLRQRSFGHDDHEADGVTNRT